MKKFLGQTILLLSLASTAYASGMQSSKTPEQVTDLFYAAMTGDVNSAKAINEYLRPSLDGKDALDIGIVSALPDAKQKALASVAAQLLGDQHDAAADKAINAFAQAVTAIERRSTCHATSSTVEPNSVQKGEFVAHVDYTCRVPDVAKAIASTGVNPNDKPTPQFLDKAAAAINSAPVDKVVAGKFNLYSDVKYKVWRTGDPGSVLDAVMSAVPFQ